MGGNKWKTEIKKEKKKKEKRKRKKSEWEINSFLKNI